MSLSIKSQLNRERAFPIKKHVHLTSAQSDQSSQSALWLAKDSKRLQADSEDSDQPERMHRLICVFAGRTCNFVGNTEPWLNCFTDWNITVSAVWWRNISACMYLCTMMVDAFIFRPTRSKSRVKSATILPLVITWLVTSLWGAGLTRLTNYLFRYRILPLTGADTDEIRELQSYWIPL